MNWKKWLAYPATSRASALILIPLILLIASFLRLYLITQIPPGLYPDEAMNGNNALAALTTAPPAGGFKVFYPENNGREGLFMNVQALFLKFLLPLNKGMPEPWMLRLPSAIFGILTVLGLYFLAKELFNKNEGLALLAAFFLATSFWHLNFSRIGFRAIAAPFFLVWTVYFFSRSLKIRPFLNSVLAGLFFGWGFYTYISYRIMPLLFLVFIPAIYKDKNRLRATAIFLLTTFIIALPIGIYFLKHPADFFGRTTNLSVFSSSSPFKDLGLNILKTAGMFNFAGDYNWRHNISGAPELFWPIGILFIIGIIIGLARLFEKKEAIKEQIQDPYCLTFLWLILAAIPVVISNESVPHALRSILLIPPVFILAAAGGIWIYKKGAIFLKSDYLMRAISFLFLFLVFMEVFVSYFFIWGINPNVASAFNIDYVLLAKEINSLPQDVKKYVVVEAPGVLVRGIPMPAETVMFLTRTFEPEDQKSKNVYYLLPGQLKDILKSPISKQLIIFYLR